MSEAIEQLRNLNETFDVDGDVIDFAYAAHELIEDLLKEHDNAPD